jgi:hypothetical protein
MAEHRMQFKVSSLTSTTGVTLIPKVGELKEAVLSGISIELTFSVTPDFFKPKNKIVDICFEAK